MDRNKRIQERLSKEVSYALRHAPKEYGLELDKQGWVPIKQLLSALNNSNNWVDVKEVHLQQMIENSEKKRHEISDGRIRAVYGHSIPVKIAKETKEPPAIL